MTPAMSHRCLLRLYHIAVAASGDAGVVHPDIDGLQTPAADPRRTLCETHDLPGCSASERLETLQAAALGGRQPVFRVAADTQFHPIFGGDFGKTCQKRFGVASGLTEVRITPDHGPVPLRIEGAETDGRVCKPTHGLQVWLDERGVDHTDRPGECSADVPEGSQMKIDIVSLGQQDRIVAPLDAPRGGQPRAGGDEVVQRMRDPGDMGLNYYLIPP
jgi:hypothetical protein